MNENPRELKRSATNKMLCGVCGGIGKYFNIDPTVVRLLWVVLSCGSVGIGIIGYFIAAVIMPLEE